jgi:O-antigen/teichoic acid export membrane protein
MYVEDFQIGYILTNIIASLFTFVALLPDYVYLKWKFDFDLWKRMMGYGLPILVAGIAFAINEQFDKILLVKLPSSLHLKWESIPYKLGFVHGFVWTAYTLGLNRSFQPFFRQNAADLCYRD